MEFTKYDMFAYQILNYLVEEHHYQVIRVQQHKDDIWLMNAKQEHYPVIRISSHRQMDETLESERAYIRNVHRVILNLIQREGPIITLNTNPDCSALNDLEMKQIIITPTQISDEQILSTFHKLRDIIHESDQMDTEIANLTKNVEEIQQSRQQEVLEKVKAKARPVVTMSVIAISTVISMVAFVMSLIVQNSILPYVAMGAYYKMNVVAAHEYWRFLTAGFVTSDPISLLLSMFILFYVGRYCELVFERRQYLIILVTSIVMGNVFTWIGNGNIVSLGMGAGVFGVIGAYVTHLCLNNVVKHSLIQFTLLRTVLYATMMLFIPGISIINYLGGLCTGIVLGVLFHKSDQLQLVKRNTGLASLLLVISLLFLGVRNVTLLPVNKEFDFSLIAFYKKTPLKNYSQYLEKCYNKQYRLE